MGTNFYWLVANPTLPTGESVPIDEDGPRIHIGKRSAAGKYCWDCRQTFCLGGEAEIHMDSSDWAKACPKCGQAPPPPTAKWEGSAAVELGFAKPREEPPTGVGSTSSFSWAQRPDVVRRICEERRDELLIEDEYHRVYTGAEFLRMLRRNCGVEFTSLIGAMFS